MYPEFVAIYIGLGILFVMNIVMLVLIIMIFKSRNSAGSRRFDNGNMEGTNMAFCKKCATQFSASARSCPNCGTPR